MSPPVISPTGSWIVTAIFVIIFLTALVLFGLRVGKLITLLVKARREDRTDHIDDRIGEVFLVVLGQSQVLSHCSSSPSAVASYDPDNCPVSYTGRGMASSS